MSEVDRLEAAMSECREMIREAHAATKDLRAAVREARQEARALAAGEVAADIQAEVSRQLEDLGGRTREAVTAATQKVIAEFDRFGEALLGKEAYWQKASGRRSGRARTPMCCRPASCPATTRADERACSRQVPDRRVGAPRRGWARDRPGAQIGQSGRARRESAS